MSQARDVEIRIQVEHDVIVEEINLSCIGAQHKINSEFACQCTYVSRRPRNIGSSDRAQTLAGKSRFPRIPQFNMGENTVWIKLYVEEKTKTFEHLKKIHLRSQVMLEERDCLQSGKVLLMFIFAIKVPRYLMF